MKSGQRETRRAEVGDSTSASSSYQLLFSILNCTCCLRSNAPKLDREPGLDSADAHGETAASGCPVERSSTGLYLKAAKLALHRQNLPTHQTPQTAFSFSQSNFFAYRRSLRSIAIPCSPLLPQTALASSSKTPSESRH